MDDSAETFQARMMMLGRHVTRRIRNLQGAVMDAIQEHVIIATPLKIGRARNGWRVTPDAPSTVKDMSDGPFDKSGRARISMNRTVIKQFTEGLAGKDRPLFLTNNVDYIDDLNRGTSAQAPAGFVEKASVIARRRVKEFKL